MPGEAQEQNKFYELHRGGVNLLLHTLRTTKYTNHLVQPQDSENLIKAQNPEKCASAHTNVNSNAPHSRAILFMAVEKCKGKAWCSIAA